ncbi:MAG: YlxR family protein [Cyanobium sp.]
MSSTPRPVLRRCVACRTVQDRRGLWRVVREDRAKLVLDTGMGRSAYLCPTLACLEEARRRKRLQKGLRCPVPDSVFDTFRARLSNGGGACAEAR